MGRAPASFGPAPRRLGCRQAPASPRVIDERIEKNQIRMLAEDDAQRGEDVHHSVATARQMVVSDGRCWVRQPQRMNEPSRPRARTMMLACRAHTIVAIRHRTAQGDDTNSFAVCNQESIMCNQESIMMQTEHTLLSPQASPRCRGKGLVDEKLRRASGVGADHRGPGTGIRRLERPPGPRAARDTRREGAGSSWR